MTSEVHPTNAACLEAIDRIARTPDGATFYVFLQRQLMSVSPTSDPSALQTNHGERSFAAKLISVMAKGIFESGGRTSSSGSSKPGTDGGEQPLVVPSPRAVRVSGADGGSRRRITEHTRVPGWDRTDDEPG